MKLCQNMIVLSLPLALLPRISYISFIFNRFISIFILNIYTVYTLYLYTVYTANRSAVYKQNAIGISMVGSSIKGELT